MMTSYDRTMKVSFVSKRSILTLAALASLYSIGASSQNAEWDQWRGPNRDGKSPETGLLKSWPPDGPSLAWHTSEAGIGYSSFSSVNGRLYTQGDRGQTGFVIALDAASGKTLWTAPNGPSYSNSYGDGQRGTPTVDGDRLYALSATGDLACLETVTGRVIWRKDIVREYRGSIPQWGYSESPLVVGDRVMVHAGGQNASIVALNKLTGATLWRTESDPAAYSSGVIAHVGDVTQVIYFSDHRTLGVDVRDGRLLWSYDRASNSTANVATPVVSGTRVLVSSGYDTGAALLELSPSGAREVYFTRNMQSHYSSVVLVGDYVYGFSDSILTAMRFADGNVAWRNRSVGKGSLIYADDRLYLYGEDGIVGLAEATPQAYREQGRFRLPGNPAPTWAPNPIITNGKLILRSQEHVYAYEMRSATGK
jgi:outer membrane protein assembly factor BamB